MKRLHTIFISIFIFFFVYNSLFAQKLSLIPYVGLKKHISWEWKMSHVIGMELFYKLNPKFDIGISISHNKWKINDKRWLENFGYELQPENATKKESSGDQSIFELTPQLRYLILNKGLRIYLHTGITYCSIKASTIHLKTTFRSGSYKELTVENGKYTGSGIGIQLGYCFQFIGFVNVLPKCNLFWVDGSAYLHFSINAGIVISEFFKKD